jgi:hypothetical protein
MPYNTKPIGVAYADPQLDSVSVSGAVTAGSVVNGTSASPVTVTSATSINTSYGSTSAASGDTRLQYSKLTFTSTGSGETLRAFSVVTGAGAAATGTINGAHVTLSVNGSGTISGAGNALRATIGGSSTNPGGTLAAIQCDSDFATGGTWTNASFIRCTNSGTGAVDALFSLPAKGSNLMVRDKSSAAVTQVIKILVGGTPYYIMVSDAV